MLFNKFGMSSFISRMIRTRFYNNLTFNKNILKLSGPPVSIVKSWRNSYKGVSSDIIDMSQAVPGYPPHENVMNSLINVARDIMSTKYGPCEGDTDFRIEFAKDVSSKYNANINAEEIQVTSGCNQAFIATILAFASNTSNINKIDNNNNNSNSKDSVLVFRPVYFNHESTLEMLGIDINYIDLDSSNSFVPVPSTINKALTNNKTTKVVVLVSPNNPTGTVYSSEVLEEIFLICREKGAMLVLDETYRDFLPPTTSSSSNISNESVPHQIFSKYPDSWHKNFVSLYSFSKAYCIPGARLGAVIAGKEVVHQLSKVIDNIQICGPMATQQALTPLLRDKEICKWKEENSVELNKRIECFKKAIDVSDGWTVVATGSYFAYVQHPWSDVDGIDSFQVAKHMAREIGVIAIPGTFFGDGQKAYLRFACANAEIPQIMELSLRLNQLSAPSTTTSATTSVSSSASFSDQQIWRQTVRNYSTKRTDEDTSKTVNNNNSSSSSSSRSSRTEGLRDALPFKYFVQRAQVLNLYRDLLRNARRADRLLNNNHALQHEVVKEYRINQHLQDNSVVKSLLVDGTRKLELIRSMAQPQEVPFSITDKNSTKDGKDDDESDYVRKYKEKESSQVKGTTGSWIDEEDEDGPRGRVGVDWPWER